MKIMYHSKSNTEQLLGIGMSVKWHSKYYAYYVRRLCYTEDRKEISDEKSLLILETAIRVAAEKHCAKLRDQLVAHLFQSAV